ncbi:MAG: ABC transporter ATP-binding protein [Verrucomicrobiales bacterium]|nr:ABC transporter ATP-binding protein [Verrucomicrobiales bacterium]
MLRVSRLSKSFGTLLAAREVSFEVRAGEIYGLLGPNGAGKTTTLSMICGLLRPDTGDIHVDGTNFWSEPNRAKRILGVAPQDLALYEELTGRENLEFWGRLAGLDRATAVRRAGELLEALALVERAGDLVKNYSGGMKRRINLGAALMHRPRLLLLDEPTVGIDPQARARVVDFIQTLASEGMAILYTTHYLEEAEQLCHRVGILDHGKLHAEGTVAELQQRLGGERFFVIEGRFADANPASWNGFEQRFKILQRTDRQIVAAAMGTRDPSDCLRELLALPVPVENVTLKRPSLNDVFLQLTGREWRD